jgi:FtsP/CotA-like multicopper oxidase with cupredoxin domain
MRPRAAQTVLWLVLAAVLLVGAALFAATEARSMGMTPGKAPAGAGSYVGGMTGQAMLSGGGYSSHKVNGLVLHGMVTTKQREAAARRAAAERLASSLWSPLKALNNVVGPAALLAPLATPDYFGAIPNWANTQLATVVGGVVTTGTGVRKFVDSLPLLNIPNNLGQQLQVAVADTITYPGSDYYEIAVRQYSQKLHSDIPATRLRGYVQTNNGTDPTTQLNTMAPTGINYLGPIIVAQRDRPVRIKFTNELPTGTGGNLFIPTDTSVMGAGDGPVTMPGGMREQYTQNRATLHLHGGATPWISDGTPHQWVTPANEVTSYSKGVSTTNVPDMPDPGKGSMTFFYTNQQSARLMFYHDHAYGLTRLNVYVGEAAGYVVQDPVENDLVAGTNTTGANPALAAVIPADQIPIIIQDRTFVPDTNVGGQLAQQDPTWDTANWGGQGSLWFPHVYMPNQDPYDNSGAAPMGRWDYGPWFWPPFNQSAGLVNGPIANPYFDPVNAPWEPPVIPGTPNPSLVPEGFMDTMLVNGTAYPYTDVQPKAYRLRILNASNDRMVNLQMYTADVTTTTADAARRPNTEVAMVPAVPHVNDPLWPASWPTDGRAGGVPDPTKVGPSWIQIGTEGGFLPSPVTIPNQPVTYNYNRRDIVVLNVTDKSLFLGPAERADVIVDFSQYAGKTIILYQDAPTPVPAYDPRTDYYSNDPDQTSSGGAPSTPNGYGPNTRTVMQFRVAATAPAAAYNEAALRAAWPAAYRAAQDVPIVPEAAYGQGAITGVDVTANGSGYTTAPTVTFTGGGGSGAAARAQIAAGQVTAVILSNAGAGYTSAPTVGFTGGGGTLAAATATVSSGPYPAAYPNTYSPIGNNSLTFSPPGATTVGSVNVTNAGSGYTSLPTVAFSGGGGSGATAVVSAIAAGRVTGITVTAQGTGYTSAPTVTISGGGGSGATGTAVLGLTIGMQPKAIQELFELDYGRMNATLGVELPFTNAGIQTTIPLGYVDPQTEVLTDSMTPGPVIAGDGTQIWKITHNGVDTHAIHFHLFNVQVINRVGWDGAIRPPGATDLGWKETVIMNPLEDCIVALRPTAPNLPFKIGDSIRPLDPTMPVGTPITVRDPSTGNLITVSNSMTNFGWEYVWHCHLLGHEENDMMRPMVFQVSPAAPALALAVAAPAPALAAAGAASASPAASPPLPIGISWVNNATVPKATNFFIQRSTDSAFKKDVKSFSVAADVTTFTDGSALPYLTYYYRVRAENKISYSTWATANAVTPGMTLSIVRSARVIKPRQFVTLSGTLNPAGSNTVAVYVKAPHTSQWAQIANRALSSGKNWTYSYRPTRRGTYRFYAVYDNVKSATISVVVR